MRWGSLLLIFTLLGCERGGLRSIGGDLELSSRALHFEPTFLGFPSSQPLVLRNTSRVDRRVTVTSKAPFSSEQEVTVPGGAELTLAVHFTPSDEGPAQGVLSVGDGLDVALAGLGLRPPACVPSAACLTSVFDPARGACVESSAADGLSCVTDNACFLGGTCSKGLCLGASRDCADTNRCTLDACDPAGGCVHLPTACATPSNPCKVARCDPALGCLEADAQDGVACGPSDCSTAQVCMLGECKRLPVPDGATCAPATACQGAGICQHNSCERPAVAPLTEAWSYDFPGNVAGFRGVTDAAENLYWVECAFGGLAGTYCNACTLCAATSYTRDGALRFRKVLTGALGYEEAPLHLLSGAQLVFAMPYSVGAVASSDGSPLWNRDFYGPLPGAPDVANFFSVTALAADATGVYVLASRYHNSSANHRQSALLKLNPATGATIFSRFFDGELQGAVVDENNNLYVGFTPRTATNPIGAATLLVSLNASGVERWRVEAGVPIAAFNGEVIVQGGEVRSTLDGTRRALGPGGSLQRNALMGSASRTLLRDPPFECCPTCSCPQPIPRIDAIGLKPGVAAVSWQTTVASSSGVGIWGHVSDSVASRQSDLLVAGGSGPNFTSLVGLTNTGAERFSCEIPRTVLLGGSSSSRFSSAVALLNGRWAVVETIECHSCIISPAPRLRVFEVPGEKPALHGWVGAQGSASGGSRPLP